MYKSGKGTGGEGRNKGIGGWNWGQRTGKEGTKGRRHTV